MLRSLKRHPIPEHVDLPFGYRVMIKQIPRKELEGHLGNGVMASWVVEDQTIYLDKSRPIKKRRADLAHELVHALADWQAKVLGGPLGDAKN